MPPNEASGEEAASTAKFTLPLPTQSPSMETLNKNRETRAQGEFDGTFEVGWHCIV